MDLDRLLPHGLRRSHEAAREAQDPLARLQRSDRSARSRQEPARAALGRPPDFGPAATSRPQRRRTPCEAARASGARASPAPPSRRPAEVAREAPLGTAWTTIDVSTCYHSFTEVACKRTPACSSVLLEFSRWSAARNMTTTITGLPPAT